MKSGSISVTVIKQADMKSNFIALIACTNKAIYCKWPSVKRNGKCIKQKPAYSFIANVYKTNSRKWLPIQMAINAFDV
jgi:hypothetical protein